MEVRPGYKQTEVGVIPQEWEVRTLPEISWFQEGPGLRNWQFTTSGMKVINVTNLENGVLNLDLTDRHISLDEFNRTFRHFAVDAADIVMASSGNSYSKTAIVRPQDLPLVMNTSVIRFKPSKGCDYGFLCALLNSPRFRQQIDLMITGGAQPNFGPYHLKRIVVPFPPPPEQRAIAEALSDVDELLSGLDRLIAKKRDLKQAAMQQLLTGKTRLPGFSGEWEEKRLAEMADLNRLNVVPANSPEELFTHFSLPSFDAGKIAQVELGEAIGSNKFRVPQAAVLVSKLNPRIPRIWTPDNIPVNAIASTEWLVLTPKPETDRSFLHVLCSSPAFCQQMELAATGTTGSHQRISPCTALGIVSRVPTEHAEQRAIAEVLSDMDAELAALEQRREKTRALKQGMMQELLTGNTRLV